MGMDKTESMLRQRLQSLAEQEKGLKRLLRMTIDSQQSWLLKQELQQIIQEKEKSLAKLRHFPLPMPEYLLRLIHSLRFPEEWIAELDAFYTRLSKSNDHRWPIYRRFLQEILLLLFGAIQIRFDNCCFTLAKYQRWTYKQFRQLKEIS